MRRCLWCDSECSQPYCDRDCELAAIENEAEARYERELDERMDVAKEGW